MNAPNRIAEHRKARGLSQADLAEKVNAHTITISRLERGKMVLNDDWLTRLSAVLEVGPGDLVNSEPIAEAKVAGQIASGAKVTLWPDNQIEYRPVGSGFFNNPNAFWLELKTQDFAPMFPADTLFKCEWLDEEGFAKVSGRLCFVETETEVSAGQLGFVKPVDKKDYRGRVVFFEVAWPGQRETLTIRPLNIALVTAITFPDLE